MNFGLDAFYAIYGIQQNRQIKILNILPGGFSAKQGWCWYQVYKADVKVTEIQTSKTTWTWAERWANIQMTYNMYVCLTRSGRRKYSPINVRKPSLRASGSSIRPIGIVTCMYTWGLRKCPQFCYIFIAMDSINYIWLGTEDQTLRNLSCAA